MAALGKQGGFWACEPSDVGEFYVTSERTFTTEPVDTYERVPSPYGLVAATDSVRQWVSDCAEFSEEGGVLPPQKPPDPSGRPTVLDPCSWRVLKGTSYPPALAGFVLGRDAESPETFGGPFVFGWNGARCCRAAPTSADARVEAAP